LISFSGSVLDRGRIAGFEIVTQLADPEKRSHIASISVSMNHIYSLWWRPQEKRQNVQNSGYWLSWSSIQESETRRFEGTVEGWEDVYFFLRAPEVQSFCKGLEN
jgi:hypothetical protein